MGSAESITCPRCTYQALSLFDLETHSGGAHQGTGETASPRPVPVKAQEIELTETPQVNVTAGTGHPALYIPEADPTFWLDEPVDRFLSTAGMRTKKGEIVNILLVGPTGTGKSSLPKEFAARWRRPFFTMHCQLVTEPGDWWGSREISLERGTYFQKAALVDAIETPGCVILLDEANRTHPENLNALFGFLDHRRRAWVLALHREVTVAPGVSFFVTLNEGVDYVGTNAVDRALRDRISNTARLDYPPKKVETNLLVKRTGISQSIAGKLAEFASAVRRNPKLGGIAVSTRQLLECAALVQEGLPLLDAVMFSIVNGAAADVDRKALLQSLQMSGAADAAHPEWQWTDEEE